jgi:hypothetical protein
MDLLGIEPRTFPMLRENYTTKPQALSPDYILYSSKISYKFRTIISTLHECFFAPKN